MNSLETGFLTGPSGSLHISLFHPQAGSASSRWVIQVPAFGEEMNKSRGMIARQARALADQGATVLVPDLFGTGDSSGNLSEATWEAWLEDIAYLVVWSRNQGALHLTLWGHRMGCLLAGEVLRLLQEPPQQLLLWQPVHSGKQHMTQFLRLRMAAALAENVTESVAELRERMSQGESIEIAGYFMPGSLLSDIENVSLAQIGIPAGVQIGILEVVKDLDKAVPAVTQKIIAQWTQLDIKCSVEKAIGDPFWLTQELAFSDDLISKTSACFMNTSIDSADTNKLRKQGSLLQPLQPVSQDLAKAIVFTCERDQLAGVLHQSSEKSSLAVVIVVGGPQYRVGSHRQFTFLARYLAAQGIPVLRFDYRGMGDSSGELEGFEHINSDISSAVDALQREQPWVEKIAIWGLCDGATASVFYAATDSRVRVLILVNPWVYSSQGAAKAYLKHYYSQRLFQRTFWCKVFSGDFRIFDSIQSAWGMLKGVFAKTTPAKEGAIPVEKKAVNADQPRDDLVTRFGGRLEEFLGDVVFVLSGKDLTAAEFLDASRSNRKLRRMMKRDKVSQVSLPNSDHTFSNSVARKEVEELTLEILRLY